jgi:diguanylate cyclase (GGDEF)-like protein
VSQQDDYNWENERTAELAQRLEQIRVAVDTARGRTVQSPTFSYLYDQVRHACDASSSMKSDAVAYLANQLQRILEGALENSYRFSDHDYRRFNRTMRDLESELAGVADESHVAEARVPLTGEDRILCFVRPQRGPTRELYDQLTYYGMSAVIVRSEHDLATIIRGSAMALIIVNASCIESDLAASLRDIRSVHADSVRIVVVAEEDTFEARLTGIRAGGDAFASLPVDLASFMTQIDSLSIDGNRDPNHVLVVDDSPGEVADIALILQRAGMVTSVVTEPPHVFQVLIERKPDLIIMSAELVGCTGAELAAVIRQQEAFVAVPVLFVSSEDDHVASVEAIQANGDEVIRKPLDADRLVQSVTVRLKRSRDARFLMERDSLTGLLNHTNLKESLATEIQRAQRIGTSVSFAMVDIDHFKNVNDTYGHLIGDRVLRGLARLLEERLRKTDTVGRYGGEEFGVVFFNTDVFDAAATMNRIRDAFSRAPHQLSDSEFTVSFSCGVASFPEYRTAAALTAAADRALYTAKQSGRNRVVSA